jgi:hypothetical protein
VRDAAVGARSDTSCLQHARPDLAGPARRGPRLTDAWPRRAPAQRCGSAQPCSPRRRVRGFLRSTRLASAALMQHNRDSNCYRSLPQDARGSIQGKGVSPWLAPSCFSSRPQRLEHRGPTLAAAKHTPRAGIGSRLALLAGVLGCGPERR